MCQVKNIFNASLEDFHSTAVWGKNKQINVSFFSIYCNGCVMMIDLKLTFVTRFTRLLFKLCLLVFPAVVKLLFIPHI